MAQQPERAVQAAGGIVVRKHGGGVQVVIVHRPQYDDWTLPKGKAETGESLEDCALREVREETSLGCELRGRLPSISYHDGNGRRKEVHYWLMRPASGRLRASTEADLARWATFSEALATLTYERDRALLEPLASTTRLWLVRHADAGERGDHDGPDRSRPLNSRGWEQAHNLATRLGGERVERLVSSPYLRCAQTLEPLAGTLGLPVEKIEGLAEGHGLEDVERLLVGGARVAACTHGDVLDEVLHELRQEGLAGLSARAAKGSTWALTAQGGVILSADYTPSPD